MEFRVLGPLEVRHEGRAIPLGGRKQRAVLAHLLLRANQVVPAERLIDQVWGEEPPDGARNALQSYVSRLRAALGDGQRIEGRPPGYVLHVEDGELDAQRFQALARQARTARSEDPAGALAMLEEALALWRGPTLADLADEQGLRGEVARLDELRLAGQEDLVAAQLALDRHDQVVGELEALVVEQPLREPRWRLLMLALYRSGRQGEALAAYQRARRLLAEELGLDPSPELQQLHERILRQDPTLLREGRRLRGYRLLEQIGAGAFAMVHRAIQPHVGREVAVKVIRPELANDPGYIRRFEAEAQLVARLEHPRIVPLYDYWREPGAAYLVMRWLRGGSLRDALAQGPLGLDRTVGIIQQVAEALAAAHRQGIVHRDVKPANVLLDEAGDAYLSDFGIATEVAEELTPSTPRSSPYRPPEQARGGPVTPRTDLYSLGVVLREALAGGEVPTRVAEVIGRATAQRAEERYQDAAALTAALGGAVQPGITPLPATPAAQNPYKGLQSFREADAANFFGREALTSRLAARLAGGERLLALVGASGSGKSSVARAGLFPALRRSAVPGSSDWFLVEAFPGAHPFKELEAALLRVAVNPPPSLIEQLERDEHGLLRAVKRVLPAGQSELLLLIDQFEELFTLVDDEDLRQRFLAGVAAAVTDPRSRLRVLLTLRADFYDRPLAYQGFAELVRAGVETLVPLAPQELERAITCPAKRAGGSCQPGLVAEMVAEVSGQPGTLPLLQYALTELFERRQNGALSLEAYRGIGGVAGAVARRAEELYQATSEAGMQAARQLFLRLVTVSEVSQATRRRVPVAELAALEVDQQALQGVIEAFGRHRLLSFDRDPQTRAPTVEIAHEALLGAWDRLRGWLDAARADLLTHRRLATAGQEWQASGRDPGFLLRASRLELFDGWAASSGLALAGPERDYLEASRAQRDTERADEQARRAREMALERRSLGRLRALVAVLGAAALVATGLTVFAFDQRREARREARFATARELASAALASLEDDPERGILLGLEAVEATRSRDGTVLREAEEALHAAVQRSRAVLAIPGDAGAGLGASVSLSPDAKRVVSISDEGTGTVWDTASRTKLLTLSDRDWPIASVAFGPDHSRVATGGRDGTAKLWDAKTGRELLAVAGHGSGPVGVAFSQDGTRLATTGADAAVRVWDAKTGRQLTTLPGVGVGINLALSADGTRLVTADGAAATVWGLPAGRLVRRLDLPAFDVAVSPDGERLAVVGLNGLTTVWDLRTGKQRLSLTGHRGHVNSVEFSRDGGQFTTGSDDGTVRVWDATTGAQLMVLSGQAGQIDTVDFGPDGTRVAACCGGGRAMVWDITPQGSRELLTIAGHQETIFKVTYSRDGRRLATASADGTAKVWDATKGRELLALMGHRAPVGDIAFSPDGKRLATAGFDQTARLWDATTGAEQLLLRGHAAAAWGVAFSPDGGRLATVGEDAKASVWDTTTGKQRLRLAGHTGAIWKIAYSPDGTRLATVSSDGVPRIFDAASGRALTTLRGHSGNTVELGFSPGGTLLATASLDGTARVWDIATGRPLHTLTGHAAAVLDVAFSPDGKQLATASLDGTAKLWDVRSGRELLSLSVEAGAMRLAFSPDGARLAVGDDAGSIRLYLLRIEELVKLARTRVTRRLTDDECRQYLHRDRCPVPPGRS